MPNGNIRAGGVNMRQDMVARVSVCQRFVRPSVDGRKAGGCRPSFIRHFSPPKDAAGRCEDTRRTDGGKTDTGAAILLPASGSPHPTAYSPPGGNVASFTASLRI